MIHAHRFVFSYQLVLTIQERMEKLQPILQKLRGLDPKTFGKLSGMLQSTQQVFQILDVPNPITIRAYTLMQCKILRNPNIDSKLTY